MLTRLFESFGAEFDIVSWLIRIFVVLIAITVHEYSHGMRAYKLGDDTAFRAGRLTLNPIAHLDPLGTVMMVIASIGWAKPVPINPILFTRAKTMRRGIVEVSLAGPISNFIMSFIAYFFLNIILTVNFLAFDGRELSRVVEVLYMIFEWMFILNIYFGTFNLLPIPPLDGYKIFGALLPGNLYYKIMEYERYIGLVFIAIVIFARGTLSAILSVLTWPMIFIIRTPIDLLFTLINNIFS